jgi:predicted transcriptional regulator
MEDTLTIRLDESVAAQLAEEAKRTKRSKGQIVREALAEYMREIFPITQPTQSKTAARKKQKVLGK